MNFDNSKGTPFISFDLPKEQSSIIKVIGIGGGGSNAVNHMYEQGIRGVNFVICNTDSQAMDLSTIPNKIRLGPSLTSGLGAGSDPSVGRMAAEESHEEIRSILEKNTKMVFITAGMGGGTGTGGAPVVAKIAKEMGILTVGIVTTPFFFEGRRKLSQAKEGIDDLRQNVDSIIIISNDKIREIYGNLTRSEAFAKADNILAIAARSISEIITFPGKINVDFADVKYVMKDSGVAIMGAGTAEGQDRALRAIEMALSSPLLNDNNIRGAKKILLNITSGVEKSQITIDEISDITDYVLEACGQDTDIIFGTCDEPALGDKLTVTVIATGFEESFLNEKRFENKVVLKLDDRKKNEEKPEFEPKKTDSPFTVEFSHPAPKSEIKEEKPEEIPQQKKSDDTKEPFSITIKKPEPAPQRDEQKEHQETVKKSIIPSRPPGYSTITEMEIEPAYKRRNIQLSSTPHSSESALSRYTLSKDDPEEQTAIRKNNSFLHDNVD